MSLVKALDMNEIMKYLNGCGSVLVTKKLKTTDNKMGEVGDGHVT